MAHTQSCEPVHQTSHRCWSIGCYGWIEFHKPRHVVADDQYVAQTFGCLTELDPVPMDQLIGLCGMQTGSQWSRFSLTVNLGAMDTAFDESRDFGLQLGPPKHFFDSL